MKAEEMLIIRRGEWMSFFNNNKYSNKYPPAKPVDIYLWSKFLLYRLYRIKGNIFS